KSEVGIQPIFSKTFNYIIKLFCKRSFVFKVPKSSLEHSNIVALAYTILSALILIPIAWGLNRYVPFLLGYNAKRKSINQ
ncbi:hypothetical protein C7B67_19760, partial [filamentous cyanobacterium Phorm 6]